MGTSKSNRGIVQMVLCASLWSIGGIFIKLIPWNPFVIAGFRSLVAALCVVVYMIMAKIKFKLNKSSLLSGVFICTTFFLFVTANKMTTSANAIVLQFTAPVFLLIISAVFFGQKFKWQDVVAVGVTLGGIALFFVDSLGAGNLIGNCVAVASGLSMAAMFLFSGKADESERMSGIMIGHILTACIGIPFMLFNETRFTSTAVVSILALGVAQLGIPYVLYGLAAKTCPPLLCSLIGAIEPLLNPVWVMIFDGETPGIFALIGGVIVIAAVSLWCVWSDKAKKSQAA